MELISSQKPNLWASLADEVPAWVPEKRNKTSVDRTLRWLDDCLALDPVSHLSLFLSVNISTFCSFIYMPKLVVFFL